MKALLVLLALVSVWAVYVSNRPVSLPKPFLNEMGERVHLGGVVVSDPDVRDTHQRITIDVHKGEEQARVLAIANRNTKISVGDSAEVSGTLALPEPFAGSEGGRVFRYDKYLQKDGVQFLLNFSSITVTKEAPWYSLPVLLARIKRAFIDGLSRALPEPYATLASGIIVGGKQGLGTELLGAFVVSGLVQIIVLSGYNVMIIAESVMRALRAVHVSKRIAAIVGAVALIAFVLMAGAGAASVRAGLMALIALYARASARTYVAGRALILVCVVMILWNPFLLMFDPGFVLSVIATAGLIWLSPLIELKLMWLRNNFWRGMVATTLAAQAAVLPLLLYETGTLSLVAIPASLVVLPIIPAAMATSGVAALSGMFFSVLAPVFGFPAYLLTRYIIEVAKFSASLPYAAMHLAAFPFWLVALVYALMIYFVARSTIASKRASTTLQLRLSKKAST